MSEKIYLMERSVYDPNNRRTDIYSEATTSKSGLMSSSDKSKLNGIASGANKTVVDSTLSSTSTNPVQNKVIKQALDDAAYTLPVATDNTLGGIKSGGNISISDDGSVTVNSVNGKTLGTSVPSNAVFTDTKYTLPTASTTVLGGVKVDGTTIKISNGIISASGATSSSKILVDGTGSSFTFTGNYNVFIFEIYNSSNSNTTMIKSSGFVANGGSVLIATIKIQTGQTSYADVSIYLSVKNNTISFTHDSTYSINAKFTLQVCGV